MQARAAFFAWLRPHSSAILNAPEYGGTGPPIKAWGPRRRLRGPPARDKMNALEMSKKTTFRFAVIGLLTAVFLFFFLRSVDWREVVRYLSAIDIRWAGIALLVSPVHLFTRGYRWKYLVHHEKRDVRFRSLWSANAVGFTVTYIFPGRLGELAKPLFLARREGIRPGFAIGTAVVERIFDILTMCFFLGVFLMARPFFESRLSVSAEGYSRLYLWGAVGVIFALILLVVILLFYFCRDRALEVSAKFLRFLRPLRREKVLGLLREFIDGLRIFHNIGDFVLYILLGFVVWLSIMATYWVYLFTFRFPVPFYALFPYIFLTAVGASIPTPGMVGGFDSFSKLGLVAFMAMDPNQAVGFTLVVHALQLVVNCLIGYTILWKEGMSMLQLKALGKQVGR